MFADGMTEFVELWPRAGAYEAGGEEDEGVEGFCSFSLMRRNRRIKADIIGPIAQSGRFPAMSAVARAPSPVEGGRSPWTLLMLAAIF